MKKGNIVLLVSAIVIEVVAVILIIKAIVTGSSPAQGLMSLGIGLIFLVIAMRGKSRSSKTDAG